MPLQHLLLLALGSTALLAHTGWGGGGATPLQWRMCSRPGVASMQRSWVNPSLVHGVPSLLIPPADQGGFKVAQDGQALHSISTAQLLSLVVSSLR